MNAKKIAAASVMALYVGAVAEDYVAGPFDDVKWWRMPLSGAGLMAAAGAIAWAQKTLNPEASAHLGGK